MEAAATARNATRSQLRSLGRLIDHNRYRGVTITSVADRAGLSIAYISEISRGLLPGGRKVSLAEYVRIQQIIRDLAGGGK